MRYVWLRKKALLPLYSQIQEFLLSIQTQFYPTYCHFKFFHIKLSGHHVMLLTAYSSLFPLFSASRPALEMSPTFKKKSTRHPGSVSQEHIFSPPLAGTLRSCCSSRSSKAANSLYFKLVRALLFPQQDQCIQKIPKLEKLILQSLLGVSQPTAGSVDSSAQTSHSPGVPALHHTAVPVLAWQKAQTRLLHSGHRNVSG